MSALAAELGAIDLGDRRLNRRAQRLAQQLGEKPTLSIPAACGGWGETRAAYRLFDHPEVTAERVLAPHRACTEERLRAYPRVLCIQDTTELDYTTKKGIAGLGPLNYETRWGMYLHPTLALTPERVPLGLLDLHSWVREPGSLGEEKDPNRPLEEKESLRWVDGFARVNALAEQLTDTRLTYIADREGDLYDLFVEAPCPERGADWLVRVQHTDRLLADGRKLRAVIDAAPVLTEITFERPATNGRRARTVHQQIKAVRVTLKPPARPDRTLAEVTVTALLATEPDPPADEDRDRLAAVDQPDGRHPGAGDREALLVSLQMANRNLPVMVPPYSDYPGLGEVSSLATRTCRAQRRGAARRARRRSSSAASAHTSHWRWPPRTTWRACSQPLRSQLKAVTGGIRSCHANSFKVHSSDSRSSHGACRCDGPADTP
jgi:hypothetical protein